MDPGTGAASVVWQGNGFGNANGVNDKGASVRVSDLERNDLGRKGKRDADSSSVGFTSGGDRDGGRDIDNAGHGVFNFSGPSYDRTYLRTVDGTGFQTAMIELPPLPGDVSTYGRRVSEVSGTTVYVAGTSYLNDRSFHAMRWTIDLNTNSIVNAESRPETSSSSDVSTGGSMSGSITGEAKAHSIPLAADGTAQLNPPKAAEALMRAASVITAPTWSAKPPFAFAPARCSGRFDSP